MKPKTTLSKTAQRGYLYLALIVIILLIIIFIPQPKETPAVSSNDSLPAKEVFSTPTHTQPDKAKHHAYRYPNRPYRQTKESNSQGNSQTTLSSDDTIRMKRFVPPAKRKPLVVELNSADTLTLQLLHGIGPTYAKRIVGYRTRLGGFVSLDQLMEVYGFSPELLAHIAPHLTLNTDSIRRIEINTVPLKQLIKHPYIDYYQARDLIAWRDKGHHYETDDDLRLVQSMDDSTIHRLLPYISFKH